MDAEEQAENPETTTPKRNPYSPRRSTWSVPRGDRLPDGRWQYTLDTRPVTDATFPAREGREVEGTAVAFYRNIIRQIRLTMAERDITIRELAKSAGISLSVSTAALTGSSWPRWPTLTTLASALDATLRTRQYEDVPALLALLMLDRERAGKSIKMVMLARGELRVSDFSEEEQSLIADFLEQFPPQYSGRDSARDMGVRKNTYYDLLNTGRSPSSSVVLGLAAINREPVRLVLSSPATLPTAPDTPA